MPRPLLDRPVLFFGGKGGVGKTTIAAAFAVLASDRGHRTLLVSTDPAHSTSDVLGAAIGAEPTPVGTRLTALEIDPAAEADRYIADVRSRLATSIPARISDEVDRQIDIARVSPGAEESALFDRFVRILDTERPHYDRIIFDTAPTGHALRLLTLPETMSAWVSGLIARRHKVNVLNRMWRTVAGAAAGERQVKEDPVLQALEERRQRFVHARQTIANAQETAFVFVIVPERLPILETRRAVQTLAKYHIPVGGIVVNRVLPVDADGTFLARRRERESRYLAEIDQAFDRYPIYRIPLLDADVVGVDALRDVVAMLPVEERNARS